MRTVLDCNAYDDLAAAGNTLEIVRKLIRSGLLTIVASRSLWDEIEASPHLELARSLSIEHVGESIAFCNGACTDGVGTGDLYFKHIGSSNKHNDALIADAAQYDAEYLVSGDTRLRNRMNAHAARCKAVEFAEFVSLVEALNGDA